MFVFCSTLSSVQNSLGAVLLEDIFKPVKIKTTGKPFNEKQATRISMILGYFISFISNKFAQTTAVFDSIIR